VWLQERVTAREAHRELALQRQQLVRLLYDYATGASHDQGAALEASAAIRKNIMEEVRHPACRQHTCFCYPGWVQRLGG
jgi:hypothetical protein